MSHLFNVTNNNFPFLKDGTYKDSQAQFDPVNNLITVSVPVLRPLGITEVSSTYTIVSTDDLIRATANTFTITLPTSVGITGETFQIKNAGDGVITLEGNGSETIDGALNVAIATKDDIKVMSEGAGWDIIT